jgi:hypothetical protein
MDFITRQLTLAEVAIRSKLQSEKGLSALEYIVMMVALVLIIFAAFQLLGGRIFQAVNDFISDVFG